MLNEFKRKDWGEEKTWRGGHMALDQKAEIVGRNRIRLIEFSAFSQDRHVNNLRKKAKKPLPTHTPPDSSFSSIPLSVISND